MAHPHPHARPRIRTPALVLFFVEYRSHFGWCGWVEWGGGVGGGGDSDVKLSEHVCPYPLVDAPNYGDRVPVDTAPGPVPVYRAQRIPTHRVRALQLRRLRSVLYSEPHGNCRCTQRACEQQRQDLSEHDEYHSLHLWNSRDLANRDINDLVHEQPGNLYDFLNRLIMGICLCVTTGMLETWETCTTCIMGATTTLSKNNWGVSTVSRTNSLDREKQPLGHHRDVKRP